MNITTEKKTILQLLCCSQTQKKNDIVKDVRLIDYRHFKFEKKQTITFITDEFK